MIGKTSVKVLTPINIVGFILVMVAGWVDTIGVYFFLDESSSYMTGRAAKIGRHIFNGEIRELKNVLLVVISFIVGACIATLITKKVGISGGLFFTGIIIVVTVISAFQKEINIALITIPMAMGGQNAATSLTAINRTTHLTGPATDIGINIAKGNWNMVVFWVLRWVGFALGAAIAYRLIHVFRIRMIHFSYILLLPAMIIILTSVILKVFFQIPLLEDEGNLPEKQISFEI